MKSTLSLIAAMGENRVIGNKGKIPWHIPEDFKRFKSLTLGHPVIMGRKTFESIGKPLPKRTNIVVTRNTSFTPRGWNEATPKELAVVHTLEKALEMAKKSPGCEEMFIIGGAQIYKQALPLADKLYLTIVKGDFVGDAFFPDYSRFDTEISREEHKNENYQFTFLDLEAF